MTDAKIMIVEDNAPGTAHLEECLKNLGYTVCAAISCGRQALEKAADTHPDLSLVNLRLEGEITGPEVAEQIGNRFDIPVLYLIDEAEGDLLQEAQGTNAFGYVLRPFEAQQLHLNILTALSMHEKERRHKETEVRLKQTIDKLEDFTHLMEAVFNSMNEGVAAVDENGRLMFCNSSALRIAGEHPEPVEADIYTGVERYGVFKNDGERFDSLDDNPLGIAMKGGTTDEAEVFLRNEFKPEGVHIKVNSRPLLRETGVLKGAVVVFRDITTEKKMTAELDKTMGELRYQSELMETVLNATGDAIAMYNNAGCLVFTNQLYESLLGLKESELKKMPPRDLEARVKEQFREPDLGDLEEISPLNDDNVVEPTGAGEEPKLFYRSTAPVCDSQQEEIGSLIVYRDVSKEIEAEQMKAELLRLRTELETIYLFPNIIGTSPAMKQVYALMKQTAESDITVFISGESGTGKELVANALHLNSSYKNGPFVALDCAAIPETLIESELFGHERGAFTGATTQRIGAFERANGGTLFLDEIGDMPYILQGKLLRVLQEREIQRVGGTTSISIDIRVIAATNKDLEHVVRAGKFRQDLFYRIAAFPIAIPSLRERREDIPLLARHFLEKYTAQASKSISGISTLALRLLLQYDWPGNVRELENAIARAVLLETTEVLQVGNLPSQLSPAITLERDPSAPLAMLPLAEIEREALIYTLEATGNNITQAVKALGISRATLYRKLKKYNIVRD